MSLTSTFYIAQSGLSMARTALEVVSHNVANVNTPGYSRQRINLESRMPFPHRAGPMGTGVDAQNITRMYDQFITANLIEKSSTLGKAEAQKIMVDALEFIFNESAGNGLSDSLSDFWKAWAGIATPNTTEGNPERENLIQTADTLAGQIKQARQDMDNLKNDINRRIDEAVIEVNSLVEEIAELNLKIIAQEAGQLHQANDLRDQRDQHILDLSMLMDIDYYEDPANGAVSVITPKGTPLVMVEDSWKLKTTLDQFGDIHVEWDTGTGGSQDITDDIDNGRIGGLITLRDDVMFDFYQQLEAFTEELIFQVNAQHAQGVGLAKFTDLTSSYAISQFAINETDYSGEDNNIVFTAQAEGVDPERVGIQFVKAASPGSQLLVNTTYDVATDTYNIQVTLPVNGNGDPTVTAEEVAELINTTRSPNLTQPAPFPPAGPPYLAGDLVYASFPKGERGLGIVEEWTDANDPYSLGFNRLNSELRNTMEFGDRIKYGFTNARYETKLQGDENDLVFTAVQEGAPGENISIEYADPGAANQALSVVVNGNAITVNLATDATGQITTTAEDIFAAIQNDPAASALVAVERASGQSGAGRVAAMDPKYLDRSGSFDLFTYNPDGEVTITQIIVNPDDTKEDILNQIGATFGTGVEGMSAEIVERTGEQFLRLKADDGWEFAFGNDNANALSVLGLNTFFEGTGTTTIQVNDVITNDIKNIANGRLNGNGVSPAGDNANALDIADVKDQKFNFRDQYSTISEAYNTLTADIGATTHAINRTHDFTQSLVDQINQQRDLVSAVNLDEEMADLMKYQYMYQASAKMIAATDELLQTLMAVK